MAKVKQIKLTVGSSQATIDLGDVYSKDFEDIERPKASVKSCQACLNAILDALRVPQESPAS